ncbi:MAG: hypothetical protein JWO43_47 [Candidatus Adlerbacteria bacterium]|nr:hypothetical protein [Candidatus Adlerbacteria bacterium]
MPESVDLSEVENCDLLTESDKVHLAKALDVHKLKPSSLMSVEIEPPKNIDDQARDAAGRLMRCIEFRGKNFDLAIYYNKSGWESDVTWDAEEL